MDVVYKEPKIKNRKDVITRLKYHRRIHRAYIKNPQFCKGNSGGVKHHRVAVKAYDQMIRVLEAEE